MQRLTRQPRAGRLLAVIGLCSLLLVSACSRPSEQEMITVRVVPGLVYPDAFDQVISAFQAKYPRYRVEIYQPDPDHFSFGPTTMATVVREKKADLVVAWPDLINEDLLLPLDAYLDKASLDPEPYHGLLELLQTSGRHYELPMIVHARVLVYHPDMFTAKGVAPPALGWTWEDFRATAAALTEVLDGVTTWGFATLSPADLVMSMLMQRTNEPATMADEAVLREVMSFASTLVHVDKSVAPALDIDYSNRKSTLPSRDYFNLGQTAMSFTFETRHMHKDIRHKMAWDVAPWPVWPGHRAFLPVTPQGYGIAATTAVPDAAWTFLQFLAGEESAVLLAKQGYMPAYVNSAVEQAWSDQSPLQPAGTAILFTMPRRPIIAEGNESLYWRANSMLAGQKSVEETLHEFLVERNRQP